MSAPQNLTLRIEFQTSSGRTYELDNPMDLSGGWGGESGVEGGGGYKEGGEVERAF